MWDEFKEPVSLTWIVAQSLRAVDCLVEIRNETAEPTAQLVTKDSESPSPARPDWPFCNDASLTRTMIVYNGRHLDDIASFGRQDF